MQSPIFRVATSPRVKKPGLIIADSVELFTNMRKVQATGVGRKINHTNPSVEVNALFGIRGQERDLSYSYQRELVHSTSQMSPMRKKPEKVCLESAALSAGVVT